MFLSLSTVNCRCPHGAWTDDPEGRCWVFPFTYVLPLIGSKTTFYSCTDLHHDRDWCSLDAEYKGRWANCGKENALSGKKTSSKNIGAFSLGKESPLGYKDISFIMLRPIGCGFRAALV